MRDLRTMLSGLQGLPDSLLAIHHKHEYQNALVALNAARSELSKIDVRHTEGERLMALKRDELAAASSVALHELYFETLGVQQAPMSPLMKMALEASFGSVHRWRDEFVALAQAVSRRGGWVTLTFWPREGKLVNQVAERDETALAHGVPILPLDLFEHAYCGEFGLDSSRYVGAFLNNVQWSVVYERYRRAVFGATEALGTAHVGDPDAVFVDVRRAGGFDAAKGSLPGATWRDPTAVAEWANELPRDKAVVLYCVYGHEVSRAATLQLRSLGVDARFLGGGIDGWEKAGGALEK